MQKPHKTGVTGGPLALQPGQARAQLGSCWVRAGASAIGGGGDGGSFYIFHNIMRRNSKI